MRRVTNTLAEEMAQALSREARRQGASAAAVMREALATRLRYTAQDWERDNAGCVYESTTEMDAALDEYCALPDAESA